MGWSMFGPCEPCCNKDVYLQHGINGGVSVDNLRNFYLGAEFQVTYNPFDGISQITPAKLAEHKLFIASTHDFNLGGGSIDPVAVGYIKDWFDQGNKRIVLWNAYDYWHTQAFIPPSLDNSFQQDGRTGANSVLSLLGSSMSLEVDGVISTGVGTGPPPGAIGSSTQSCELGAFVGSHYLKTGLTVWDEHGGEFFALVSGSFGPAFLGKFRYGSSRVAGGTPLVEYGDSNSVSTVGALPGVTMAVEKLGDSEIVLCGSSASWVDNSFVWVVPMCQTNRDIFLLRMMDDVQ